MNADCEELLNYAMYCNDEYGEACIKLCSLMERSDMISDEIVKLVEADITDRLEYFKENSEFVTEEITETREVTTLEWKDE